jgi:hypothetical protein
MRRRGEVRIRRKEMPLANSIVLLLSCFVFPQLLGRFVEKGEKSHLE